MARAIVPLDLVESTVYLHSVVVLLVVNNVSLDQMVNRANAMKTGLVSTATYAEPTTLARTSCLVEIDWGRTGPATPVVRPFVVRTKSAQ